MMFFDISVKKYNLKCLKKLLNKISEFSLVAIKGKCLFAKSIKNRDSVVSCPFKNNNMFYFSFQILSIYPSFEKTSVSIGSPM